MRCARPTPTSNLKANEYLYRRVDLEDVVSAHLLPLERAPRSASAGTSSAPPRLHARGPRRVAQRRARRGAPPRPRLRGDLRPPRLDDVREHRARLRQLTRARRAGLGSALRLPPRARQRRRRRGSAQPAGPRVGARATTPRPSGPTRRRQLGSSGSVTPLPRCTARDRRALAVPSQRPGELAVLRCRPALTARTADRAVPSRSAERRLLHHGAANSHPSCELRRLIDPMLGSTRGRSL